jgi:hypothetical protein
VWRQVGSELKTQTRNVLDLGLAELLSNESTRTLFGEYCREVLCEDIVAFILRVKQVMKMGIGSPCAQAPRPTLIVIDYRRLSDSCMEYCREVLCKDVVAFILRVKQVMMIGIGSLRSGRNQSRYETFITDSYYRSLIRGAVRGYRRLHPPGQAGGDAIPR